MRGKGQNDVILEKRKTQLNADQNLLVHQPAEDWMELLMDEAPEKEEWHGQLLVWWECELELEFHLDRAPSLCVWW